MIKVALAKILLNYELKLGKMGKPPNRSFMEYSILDEKVEVFFRRRLDSDTVTEEKSSKAAV